MVLIKTAFSNVERKAYTEWTENGFVLNDTILYNDEYIFGFYSE